jgi:hypothetical protein
MERYSVLKDAKCRSEAKRSEVNYHPTMPNPSMPKTSIKLTTHVVEEKKQRKRGKEIALDHSTHA